MCEALTARACDNEPNAWQELVKILWPFWRHLVLTSRAMGPLSRSEDHLHDVMTVLVEKIGPEGGTALGLYPAWREANPDKTFEDWIRIVTAYAIRDHVRKTLGRRRERDPQMPSPKRLLNEFVTSVVADDPRTATRPAFTAAQTARELLAFARATMSRVQLAALMMWMEGAEADEIGEELCGGDADAGRKLVRAAVAILRRRFAGAEP
jgi:hypothetical protein